MIIILLSYLGSLISNKNKEISDLNSSIELMKEEHKREIQKVKKTLGIS